MYRPILVHGKVIPVSICVPKMKSLFPSKFNFIKRVSLEFEGEFEGALMIGTETQLSELNFQGTSMK